MAVTLGSSGITGVSGSATSSISTGSINASAGTDQCLIVGTSSSDDPAQTPTGVTWDVGTPQNFTEAASDSTDEFFASSLWYLVSITQATDTATATWASNVDDCCIYIAEFEGVDQSTPIGNTQVAVGTGTSATVTLTGVSTGDMCVDVLGVDHSDGSNSATAETPGADQTDLFTEVVSTGSFPMGLSGSYQEGADGGVMSWTIGATGNDYTLIAAVLNAAATASAEQEGVRGRNDDGTETTATWIEAQDTDISVAPDDLFRARFLINFTGDYASTQFLLEIEEDGVDNWTEVTVET